MCNVYNTQLPWQFSFWWVISFSFLFSVLSWHFSLLSVCAIHCFILGANLRITSSYDS